MSPNPGDYFVTRTNGFWAWLVRYGTSSIVNHAGVYVGTVVGLKGPQVIEARPGGAGYRPAADYTDAIWSTGRLPAGDTPNDAQRQAIVWSGHKALGTPYGFEDLAAIALAQKKLGSRVKVTAALAKQPWWVRKIISRRTMICSQLVSAAYTDAGIDLFTDGRLPNLVSPGDLLALLQASPSAPGATAVA